MNWKRLEPGRNRGSPGNCVGCASRCDGIGIRTDCTGVEKRQRIGPTIAQDDFAQKLDYHHEIPDCQLFGGRKTLRLDFVRELCARFPRILKFVRAVI